MVSEFVDALTLLSPKYDYVLQRTTELPATFRLPPSYGTEHGVEKVFVLLSGPVEKRKKVMFLNDMLIDWIGNLRRKNAVRELVASVNQTWKDDEKKSSLRATYHSPSTINTMVRNFFAATREYYAWDFSVADFGFDGGVQRLLQRPM